jgi:hypothetical protein
MRSMGLEDTIVAAADTIVPRERFDGRGGAPQIGRRIESCAEGTGPETRTATW